MTEALANAKRAGTVGFALTIEEAKAPLFQSVDRSGRLSGRSLTRRVVLAMINCRTIVRESNIVYGSSGYVPCRMSTSPGARDCPSPLAEARTAELLDEVCDIDLDALDVALPKGFGRDPVVLRPSAEAGSGGRGLAVGAYLPRRDELNEQQHA